MLSRWHSCPQDILQCCFSDQLDYNHNAAAACACKPWRKAFISACSASTLVYGGVRTDASPSYLRQHTELTSLTLIKLPIWDNIQSCLHVAHDAVKYHSIALPTWSETLGAVSATCKQLTLDHFLPGPDYNFTLPGGTLYNSLSQFSLLQHLTLNEGRRKVIDVEALSGLLSLQKLEVVGIEVKLAGSLSDLPSTITMLRLHYCGGSTDQPWLHMQDLAHLQSLQDLDLDHVSARFGCVFASGLSLLTRLDLRRISDFVSLLDDIFPLTGLRVLCLRYVVNPDSVVPLNVLLRRLSCLQELDLLGCLSYYDTIAITPDDCRHLSLLSFSFDAKMLVNFDESSFDHFVLRAQTPDIVSKPVLRIDGNDLWSRLQDSVVPKLFHAVTHSTLDKALMWPVIFGLSEVELPLLRVLDVRYLVRLDTEPDKSAVGLSAQLNLAELYIMDSCNSSFDLAKCTSLRSVGITHRGPAKPVIGLPPFLTRLCLHNVLTASFDLRLQGLQELSSVKLGGSSASTDVTRHLPSLPQNVIELDLWDGLLTNLQQLSKLPNLNKLFMADAPNEQQLQTIRQLRQLRHVEVTGREDMHFGDDRPIPPWIDQ